MADDDPVMEIRLVADTSEFDQAVQQRAQAGGSAVLALPPLPTVPGATAAAAFGGTFAGEFASGGGAGILGSSSNDRLTAAVERLTAAVERSGGDGGGAGGGGPRLLGWNGISSGWQFGRNTGAVAGYTALSTFGGGGGQGAGGGSGEDVIDAEWEPVGGGGGGMIGTTALGFYSGSAGGGGGGWGNPEQQGPPNMWNGGYSRPGGGESDTFSPFYKRFLAVEGLRLGTDLAYNYRSDIIRRNETMGNMGALANADVQYWQDTASSLPFGIGKLAVLAADPFGQQQLGVEMPLKEAEANDAFTAAMGGFGNYSRQLREGAAAIGAPAGYARQTIEANSAFTEANNSRIMQTQDLSNANRARFDAYRNPIQQAMNDLPSFDLPWSHEVADERAHYQGRLDSYNNQQQSAQNVIDQQDKDNQAATQAVRDATLKWIAVDQTNATVAVQAQATISTIAANLPVVYGQQSLQDQNATALREESAQRASLLVTQQAGFTALMNTEQWWKLPSQLAANAGAQEELQRNQAQADASRQAVMVEQTNTSLAGTAGSAATTALVMMGMPRAAQLSTYQTRYNEETAEMAPDDLRRQDAAMREASAVNLYNFQTDQSNDLGNLRLRGAVRQTGFLANAFGVNAPAMQQAAQAVGTETDTAAKVAEILMKDETNTVGAKLAVAVGTNTLRAQQTEFSNSFRMEGFDPRMMSGQGAGDREAPQAMMIEIAEALKDLAGLDAKIGQSVKDGLAAALSTEGG